eukprot:1158994-Pelagomonas_calceolata.AAC.11
MPLLSSRFWRRKMICTQGCSFMLIPHTRTKSPIQDICSLNAAIPGPSTISHELQRPLDSEPLTTDP